MPDTIYTLPGDTYTSLLRGGATDGSGVGTYGCAIVNLSGTIVKARTTSGITHAGNGVYAYTGLAVETDGDPLPDGDYLHRWDDGAGTPTYAEDLLVVGDASTWIPADNGDAYFTVAEAREQEPALASSATYSDDDINAMRVAVEQALEHACKVAFVPRTATNERRDGTGGYELLLKNARPTLVTAASIGGAALSADQLALIVCYESGIVYYPNGWVRGRGNVLVTYTHGYESVPGRVKRAAIKLTKRFLVDTPVSDRATSMTNPEGATQFLVTAGVRGAITDVPEVNAIIDQYGVGGMVG